MPPLTGAATSQVSQSSNDQTQAGDVTATQTLDVVTVTDVSTGTTTAAGSQLPSRAGGHDLVIVAIALPGSQ